MSEYRILEGDCLDVLATLPERSVQTCITSPPYFGLRDYGTAIWKGGDAECDHLGPPHRTQVGFNERYFGRGFDSDKQGELREPFRASCGKCGATRTDSQIGLEETPEQYVANLVAVFREVRRVLRDDGTVWLNLGDSYNSIRNDNSGGGFRTADDSAQPKGYVKGRGRALHKGYKHKDLLGIPWAVAFALRADGWYLRSDIIWNKPNPMPESVTDRPTKAHEYLFLLSKSRSYFYDADSIREGATGHGGDHPFGKAENGDRNDGGRAVHRDEFSARNRRSVWTVATQPFPGSHFAVMPPKLVEPCVLAGSSPQACAECGAPWERVTERTPADVLSSRSEYGNGAGRNDGGRSMLVGAKSETIGWRPTCDHSDGSAHCTVLDPFSGAGTTGVVALRHDRDFIGIELNASYAQMARDRIYDDGPLLNTEAA